MQRGEETYERWTLRIILRMERSGSMCWTTIADRWGAFEHIAQLHPDEDVDELILAEVAFEENGNFRLGFDAGDTPAGQLYLFAEFDEVFHLSEQLVYETY